MKERTISEQIINPETEDPDAIKAQQAALAELDQAEISPKSDRGIFFLFRANAFGINGVQDP